MENAPFSTLIRAAAPYPLLGSNYRPEDYFPLDLAVGSAATAGQDLSTYEGLERYVQAATRASGSRIGYGGYLEDRVLYRSSPHFSAMADPRTIHLGLDLWTDAGHPVYAPLDGWVHSFAYNDQPLDYGPTIILRHQLGDLVFHTLYGHLNRAAIEKLSIGASIARGQAFCAIGNRHENGGWVPHLHFQVILDLGKWHGDYPGVSNQTDLPYYRHNCPDPGMFLEAVLRQEG